MGLEAKQVYKSFALGEKEEANNYNCVLELPTFCVETQCDLQAGMLHMRTQAVGEIVEQFIWHLHELAAHCHFSEK